MAMFRFEYDDVEGQWGSRAKWTQEERGWFKNPSEHQSDLIQLSVQKWERVRELVLAHPEITKGTQLGLGSTSCSLCMAHYFGANQCEECPVYQASGYKVCYDTPYTKAINAEDRDTLLMGIGEEIEFLKSLLPSKKPHPLLREPTWKARFKDREPDPGTFLITSIDWEREMVTLRKCSEKEGAVPTVYPCVSFSEIKIVVVR